MAEFSLAHLTLLTLSPPDLIEVAATAGYDYVSLRPISLTPIEPKYPFGVDRELFLRTKRKMSDTGIRLLDIELARIVPDLDVKIYEPAFAAAAELGGRFVLSSGWTPDKAYVIQKFAELCDLAKQYNLTVGFEFVTFAAMATLADAVDVVRGAGRDNGGICLDTLHFFRSGNRPEELDGLPPSWFSFTQICDGPAKPPATREEMIFAARADRQFVGQGELPIADVLNRLPEVPYSIEAPNTALSLRLSPIEFARQALVSARSYLEAHPRPRSQAAKAAAR